MTVVDVLAETRAFNVELERSLAALRPVHEAPPEATRAARRAGRGVLPAPVFLPQARWVTIPGRDGAIRLRVLAPDRGRTGAYLHVHGGGWTLGAADLQDALLWEVVEATGMTAVSVDYRLAPEHPFPAGPDDVEDAARWVAEQYAGERLAIGGESAGAHLAALTLLRLRDNGEAGDAFAAANLVFGCFDLSGTPSQRRCGLRTLTLPTPTMAWFFDNFLPGRDAEGRRAPEVSPLYADLAGLPPALFTVGSIDPLLDDSLFMAARWRAAGTEAELRVWEEGVHGFTAFPLEIARRSNAEQHAFLRG